jgi:lipoprotein-anchoring transpeptidase ErfK/SrfK
MADPRAPSHGCVRLRNLAMARLYRLLPIGAPIRIR